HATNLAIRVVRVLDTFGVCTEAQLIAGLAGLDDSVRVVNLSLGGYTVDGRPPNRLRGALAGLPTRHDRGGVAAARTSGGGARAVLAGGLHRRGRAVGRPGRGGRRARRQRDLPVEQYRPVGEPGRARLRRGQHVHPPRVVPDRLGAVERDLVRGAPGGRGRGE